MRQLKVLVVDDHPIVRAGLSALLTREEDLNVVGMATDGHEGLRLIEELNPDVAVIEYSLPGMSGVELCEEIVARHPEIPVVILTNFLDDAVVHRSLEAGAKAFVYKDVEGRDLRRVIRTVSEGESVLDPKVAGKVMSWSLRSHALRNSKSLSIRETEVMRLVAKGFTNPQIADELGLSLNTIKTYMKRVLEKLDCQRRSEAAALASRWGLL